MEKTENINQMTLFVIQNTLFVTQNTANVNQMTQNIQFYCIYGDGKKIITCTRLENMILGQLKIGEDQAKCRALE